MVTQLKTMLDSGNLKEDIIQQKLLEAFNNVPDDVKQKFKDENIDINELVMSLLRKDKKGEENISNDSKKKIKKGIFLSKMLLSSRFKFYDQKLFSMSS
jgi:hypothetical protein